MRLSLIVVTFNSADCVGPCIESARQILPIDEVIAVDNASVDDTVARLRELSDVRVLHPTGNVGFARASNMGAVAASGTHLLFLNPDVRAMAADQEKLQCLFDRSPFGLVAPLLVRTDRPRQRLEGGNPEPHWLWDYMAHTWLALWPRDLPLPRLRRANGKADWVSAAMLLAKSSEFRRLGGFDSRFFLYYEDRDLCARYRREGLPIVSTRAIIGEHLGTSSSGREQSSAESFRWSLLGWLEYVFVHDGERTARRAALLTLRTLRLLDVSLRLARNGAPRQARLERKSREIGELLISLRLMGDYDDGSSYCPNARRLFADASGPRLIHA